MQEKKNPRMKGILLAYKNLKANATTPAYTSLQKSGRVCF